MTGLCLKARIFGLGLEAQILGLTADCPGLAIQDLSLGLDLAVPGLDLCLVPCILWLCLLTSVELGYCLRISEAISQNAGIVQFYDRKK